MVELKLDTHKLKDFPGIELALGWINAAHDYMCILDIETVLRKQEIIDENLQLPKNYSFYFARLRAAQAREAVGLCKRTKDFPELCELIYRDQEAAECFERMHTMDFEGAANHDMETVRLVRDTTFHYAMRQHKDWYQKVFSELIAKGQTTVLVDSSTPDRFSPADYLLNLLFLKEALRMPDLTDHRASGKRMTQVTMMLANVGYDCQVVARAIGRGLIEACQFQNTSQK